MAEHRHITITIGDPDEPGPTKWSFVRLGLVFIALMFFWALAQAKPAPDREVIWFVLLLASLAVAGGLTGLDFWLYRRRARRASRARANTEETQT